MDHKGWKVSQAVRRARRIALYSADKSGEAWAVVDRGRTGAADRYEALPVSLLAEDDNVVFRTDVIRGRWGAE